MPNQIITFNRSGHTVKVESLGAYSPNVALDGSFEVQYHADTALNSGLKVPGTFTGTINRCEHTGKAGDELIAKWNVDHPEDQVQD